MLKLPRMFRRDPATPPPPPAPERKLRQWDNRVEDLPWVDQPGAMDEVTRRESAGELTPDAAAMLRQFITDGYCVGQGMVSPATIDRLVSEIDGLWTAKEPIGGLEIRDLRFETEGMPRPATPHAELLALDPARREEIRARGHWRIHGLHFHSAPAKEIFDQPSIRETVSTLLGRKTDPVYSITFMYGSQQWAHQDQAVFHIHPMNNLVGVWIALEDVTEDCGPLFYCPGSHREPMYPKFNNYPQTNLRSATLEESVEQREYVKRVAENYEHRRFLAKKGDVLFWHAMLIHGGDPIQRPGATRKSFVMHFIPEGCDKANEVVGPFLW